ncbi:bifunctional DNA primase/polymerase [Nocardioides daphniae]|nr:bifunctional DNA primase/polymerase [Nocardioides daphniae]QCC77420.1 DNA replication protein [Nocardioides daphniae]
MEHTAQRRPAISRWDPMLPVQLSEAPDLVTASTMLASRDIPVFPCVAGGKQPLTRHGFHDASADLATVHEWWSRWPDANIGMPTGIASGVDVVDIDVHAGGNGFDSFERARGEGLAEGWAWLVRTPSGGVHASYLRDTSADAAATSLTEQRSWQAPSRHIDFRGDGGYVVVPPSRTTAGADEAGRYRLLAVSQHPISPVDAAALRAFLEPPRADLPSPAAAQLLTRPDRLAAQVERLQQGERNRGLFWAACRMVEDGHAFDATADALGPAGRTIGLEDREILATIRSAYRSTSPRPTSATRTSRLSEVVAL